MNITILSAHAKLALDLGVDFFTDYAEGLDLDRMEPESFPPFKDGKIWQESCPFIKMSWGFCNRQVFWCYNCNNFLLFFLPSVVMVVWEKYVPPNAIINILSGKEGGKKSLKYSWNCIDWALELTTEKGNVRCYSKTIFLDINRSALKIAQCSPRWFMSVSNILKSKNK